MVELEIAEQHARSTPSAPGVSSLAELASAVREVGPSTKRPRPASFGPRFWAAFVDALVLMLLSLLFYMVVALTAIAFVASTGMTLDDLPPAAAIVVMSASLILVLLYGATEAYGSVTPGKSLVGLRVVGRDGRRTTVGRRTCRWALKQSPLICFAVAFSMMIISDQGVPLPDLLIISASLLTYGLALAVSLSCLWVLTPSRRALHDLLTGTAVYREDDVVRDAGHAFRPLPLQVETGASRDDPTAVSA